MIVHLDPRSLGSLLERTDPIGLRVICALLSLAPAGELIGGERRWAKAAGLRPRDLELQIAHLAVTPGPHGQPLLTLTTERGSKRRRVRFIPPPGLLVVHPPAAATPSAVPAPNADRRRLPNRRDSEQLRADAFAALAGVGSPGLRLLADAWLARLAEIEGGPLPMSLQIVQYEALVELVGSYGEPIVRAALRSAMRNLREVRAPERYLRATAAGLYTQASLARVSPSTASPASAASDDSSDDSDGF